MDAISFVLGVKSSQLRSSHLRELIYRGQDDDAADTAWVMAVYADNDSREWKFKRSITSNGASEYRIDGAVVSAQKYNSVLESHNILIKARNFLVFQGDVEAIASQSPKDLTKLIEQISGSFEYKAEYDRLKNEQEKASENSTFNFHQKRSINSELKQYQDQKKESDVYDRKVAEREQVILNQIMWKLYHLQAFMDATQENHDAKSGQVEKLTTEIAKAEQKLKVAEKDRAKVLKAMDKKQRGLKQLQQERKELNPRMDAVQERVKSTKKSIKTLGARLDTVRPDLERQAAVVDASRKDLSNVEKAEKKFEREQAALEKQSSNLSDSDIQEYRTLKDQFNKTSAQEKDSLAKADRKLRNASEQVVSLQEKMYDLERLKQNLEDEVLNSTTRKRELQTSLETLRDDLSSEKAALDKIQQQRAANERQEKNLNEKLQEVLEKLSQYSAEERETEKELRSKENVATLKRIFSGVRGRLTDLCRPNQRKFDVAIATVLGRNIDSIVVDTEKTAKDCIEYMREQRSGIATFLPLDTLIVKPVNAEFRSIHKQARLAIDVINYEAAIERAVQYACGTTIVCDDLSVARNICYERRVEVKAVTIDGTIIHKSGNLTGGRHENKRSGQRWTDAEVEGLRRLRDNQMAKLHDLAAQKRQENGEEELAANVEAMEARIELLQNDVDALSREIASREDGVAHADSELEELQPKLESVTSEQSALRSSVESLQHAMDAIEDKIFADFCARTGLSNIRQYEERQGALSRAAAQRRAEYTAQKARLQNHLSFEEATLHQTTDRIAKMEKSVARDQAALATFEEERTTLQAEVDTMIARIAALQSELDQERGVADQKTDTVNQVKRELAQITKESENLAKALNSFDGEKERYIATRHALLRRCKLEEIDIPLLRGSLDRVPLEETIHTDTSTAQDISDWGIEIDFEELDDDLKMDGTEATEQSLAEHIRDLDTDLERMQPNTKALDRLNGVESRLQTTEKEFERARKDAKRAKEAFSACHTKRTTLFNTAYDHISNEIDGIYKDLTKSKNFPLGGTAYLSLEDAEDPFDGGIKYHAMPPQKRFRDMDALSGGEKTMAALALLFAIHSFQPAPFFVLDEVDAALDNANVAKIANYIRARSREGHDQFVVISLKNAFFQQSDSLIGVYRPGSSKTLSLKL